MKRPYSREFPRQSNSKDYALQGIPAGLLRAARAKAKRDHLSLRIVLLRFMRAYVDGAEAPRPWPVIAQEMLGPLGPLSKEESDLRDVVLAQKARP